MFKKFGAIGTLIYSGCKYKFLQPLGDLYGSFYQLYNHFKLFTQNICPLIDLFENIHNSFIHNSQIGNNWNVL